MEIYRSASPRVTVIEEKYVRTTRFATISSGTSGTVTLPANSEVVLDDFGGTVDAVISTISGGRPNFVSAVDVSDVTVATTFDSGGSYVLSTTPETYPVAIIYRVRQQFKDLDSDSSDILGIDGFWDGAGTGGSGATVLTQLTDVSDATVFTTDGHVLRADGTQWINQQLALSDTSGTLGETRGGTNQTTYTTGDTLYSSASNTLSKLTIGAANTVLLSNGSIPTWSSNVMLLTGNQTVSSGVKTFTVLPESSATPTTGNQLVNKTYADALAAGFLFKEPVQATTTANLTATYSNGASGVGATLTATGNGAWSSADSDNYALSLNERLMVKNQTTGFQNGVYYLSQVGDGSNPWILTRVTDYDQSAEMNEGTAFLSINGTTNAGTQWAQSTADGPTVGTTTITLIQISAPPTLTASLGVEKVGNDFRADLLATGAITLSGNELQVATDNVGIEKSANAIQLKDLGVTTAKINDLAVTNAKIANSTINLTTKVTDILNAVNGGTGVNTLTANNVILGNGTSAVQFVAPSTSGNVLTSNGTTWVSSAPASSASGANTINYAKVITDDTSSVSVTNTVTETDIFSYSVAGGTLGTHKQIRLMIMGTYINTSGSNKTVRVRATYGGSTIYDRTTANLGTSANTNGFKMILDGSGAGDTAEQVWSGQVYFESGGGTTANLFDNARTTIDSTSSRTLRVSVTHSAASASTTLTRDTAVLSQLNASDVIGAPNDATYIVVSNTASLPNERALTAGAHITLTDGGASGAMTVAVDPDSFLDSTFGVVDNADTTRGFAFNVNGSMTTGTVLTIGSGAQTANRTMSAPIMTGNDTIVLESLAATLANKTLNNTNTITVKDDNITIQDGTDTTKQAVFQCSSITTGTTRTYTFPDVSSTFIMAAGTQTITGAKSFTTNTTTFSNVVDAGGATSFEVPNGAGGTTVDAAGEVCVDTTSRTLNFYDGTAEVVLNPVQSKAFVIESPTASDDMQIWRTDVAITLTKVSYLCIGGTNWVGQLQEQDSNGGTSTDVHSADITATAGTTNTSTTFSNASIDASDWVGIKTTSISGTPTRLHVTFYYRENP